MSNKVTEETANPRKQVGCINGILQLFAHSHKGLPADKKGEDTKEHTKSPEQVRLHEKNLKEKQRISTESSTTSFSSSTSSSAFSSVDSIKAASQTEAASFTSSISSRNLPKNQKHQSEDLKTNGLSVKIASKEATSDHGSKHIDSPRPSPSKTIKSRSHSSNNSNESVILVRALIPKDQHRFSCDGRETREKAAMRFKELPRLSLDSRGDGSSSTKCTYKNQEPESNKRPSGVVAKLMGLEDFPETLPISTPKFQHTLISQTCSESHLELSPPLKIPSKDRKALELFLDAMEKINSSNFSNAHQRLQKYHISKSDDMIPSRVKGTITTSKRIVIMKPSKTKSAHPASSVIAVGLPGVCRPRNGDFDTMEKADRRIHEIRSSRNKHFQDPISTTRTRTSKTKQTHSTKEDADTRSPRSLGSKSPRFAHKAGWEKHFHHTNPPSLVINTDRKPLNRQQQGSCSPPGRKNRSKFMSSYQENINSPHFGRDSRTDTELVCNDIRTQQDKENSKELLNEDGKTVVPVAIQEQPSPVSVLDAMFYRDGSPSPVKKVLKSMSQDDAMDEIWNSSDHQQLFQHTTPNHGLIINHNALETKKCMVQRQQKLYRTDEEPTLHFDMDTNLDHGYIYDILSASNLLYEDFDPNYRANQVNPSGHIINPRLFLVLEQTKAGSRMSNNSRKKSQRNLNEKIHRKLIFDSVDEILDRKALAGFSEGRSGKLREKPRGHQLLRDVCSEMDRLVANNLDSSFNHEDEALKGIMWKDPAYQRDHHNEISKIVMDVERLIFKDLVAELVKR